MKKIFIFLMILLLCPLQAYADDLSDVVTLSNCVDSNSARFILNKTEIKVKFIGVDSSNIIYDDYNDEINGKLVDDYVCSVLTNAKEIKIEYETNSDREDKYGRVLAWVYVDGVLLQKNLLELGYSKIAYLYDNYKYTEELKSSELLAKENKVGIWMDIEKESINNNSDENNIDSEHVDDSKDENVFSKLLGFINEIFEKFLELIDNFINEVL